MRVLAVDTSSEHGSVCVAADGEVLGEVRLAVSIQHSERLFRSIEFLFRYLPFTLADVDLFAAARGPGSFTGLRVGLAAMEGFAAAHGRPAAGVTTLEALAWNAGIEDAPVAAVIDARRGEIFGAVYRRVGGRLIEERPPQVAHPAAWLAPFADSPMCFCGSGVQRYAELFDRPGWRAVHADFYLAAAIAALAATPGRGPLEPLYVRRTDAEIAREKRHESIAGPNTQS